MVILAVVLPLLAEAVLVGTTTVRGAVCGRFRFFFGKVVVERVCILFSVGAILVATKSLSCRGKPLPPALQVALRASHRVHNVTREW